MRQSCTHRCSSRRVEQRGRQVKARQPDWSWQRAAAGHRSGWSHSRGLGLACGAGLPAPPAAAAWPHLCAPAAAAHQPRTVTDDSRLSTAFARMQEVLPEAASCSRRQVRRCAVSALDCHTAVSAVSSSCRASPMGVHGGCRDLTVLCKPL